MRVHSAGYTYHSLQYLHICRLHPCSHNYLPLIYSKRPYMPMDRTKLHSPTEEGYGFSLTLEAATVFPLPIQLSDSK